MMQRKARTWPDRYQRAQARRLARGLALLRPGRAALALLALLALEHLDHTKTTHKQQGTQEKAA